MRGDIRVKRLECLDRGRVAGAAADGGRMISGGYRSWRGFNYCQLKQRLIVLLATLLAFHPALSIAEPYTLHGDTLGMSFAAFKIKYQRALSEGAKIRLPNCTDSPWNRHITDYGTIPSLLQEPWHLKAGIVSCRINKPFEQTRQSTPGYTYAPYVVEGVHSNLHVYFFVDSALYQVLVTFSGKDYETLKQALLKRYAKPQGMGRAAEQSVDVLPEARGEYLIWENDVSRIVLNDKIGDAGIARLLVVHKDLARKAASRNPGAGP